MARNSLGGPGRLQNKNARTAFTARHKLAVVASFKELGDISAVIRELYPNLACSTFESRRKLIYQWIRDREALERVCASPVQAEKKKARSLGVATILSADDERVIVIWVNELRGFVMPITTTMPVFENYIPTRTLTKKGEKTVWVRCSGKEKNRVTVMLLADSDGVKYPPKLVYKAAPSQIPLVAEENRVQRNGFGVRLWKRMQKIQERTKMHVYGNNTAWWNSNLQLKFLETYFNSHPDMSVPILLLLDDFSGHWTQPVRDYATAINVIMLKVPPAYTSVCQPADASWMKPFKDQIHAQWIDNLREQIGEWRFREPFKMKAPERENVADWIRTAWDHISIKTISGGYRTTHTAVGDEN
uniref:Uncharacterized protein AlNc14C34G3105 n=1 Tax=Albugo laibachii Nc14 TaxID=890382 RepID=F0W8H9_9STRA|nr:conserved hypothetical protein [Albugo laibachii Nc14]|eukprot:CCA17434.1 conserved hypothetical protein [Albugo laibachii Nc14]